MHGGPTGGSFARHLPRDGSVISFVPEVFIRTVFKSERGQVGVGEVDVFDGVFGYLGFGFLWFAFLGLCELFFGCFLCLGAAGIDHEL